ncbi:hypothetical protein U4E84_01795 [Halorubrum sp. AD140]|uniref:DUF7524 family protein n=1 Tax=Halorubrum sp. AD140 TaxID=3050073 RepID=UPI002ACC8127|nr:hypothetical protein [Halorubrum sp. AD140]MDZ5810087.1 hypothetical protein [Halorubrum sp. AD140]
MPTLSLELNGDAVHAIGAPDRFEATGPFSIALENLGRSTHVHLHFDEALDRVCAIDEANHFVDDESTRRVHVAVADVEEPVRGKLKIVTGYGSNTRYVDVRLDPPPEAAREEVVVDEALAKPPERPPEVPPAQRAANAVDRLVQRGGLPAAVLGFVAVAVGVAIALAVDSALVSVAVGVVLVVSLAAVLLAAA